MLNSRLNWCGLLSVSILVLIWRATDLFYEVIDGEFHMYFFGLAFNGFGAGVVQVTILIGSTGLVCMATVKLLYLSRFSLNKS